MKATKYELQQQVNKLAADNLFLREQLSKIQAELSIAQERAGRAEHSARRVILYHNHPLSERRKAMLAAREEAKRVGHSVKVEA